MKILSYRQFVGMECG